jgi:molecular chaperone GrpE (heat shock protein)
MKIGAIGRFKTKSNKQQQIDTMSNETEMKPEAEPEAEAEEEEDEEEDLEKLQAEIKRMEEEAARITKETEELEKKKDKKIASSTDAAKNAGSGETPSQDG